MIYVKLPEESKTAQWGIVELQGDLNSQSGNDVHGQYIGDLHYTKQGTPLFIIGHHILTGKEVNLEKPFAVMERQRFDNEGNVCSQGSSDGTMSSRTEYVIRAIVKKKLIFKVRPKPIISNVPKCI